MLFHKSISVTEACRDLLRIIPVRHLTQNLVIVVLNNDFASKVKAFKCSTSPFHHLYLIFQLVDQNLRIRGFNISEQSFHLLQFVINITFTTFEFRPRHSFTLFKCPNSDVNFAKLVSIKEISECYTWIRFIFTTQFVILTRPLLLSDCA